MQKLVGLYLRDFLLENNKLHSWKEKVQFDLEGSGSLFGFYITGNIGRYYFFREV